MMTIDMDHSAPQRRSARSAVSAPRIDVPARGTRSRPAPAQFAAPRRLAAGVLAGALTMLVVALLDTVTGAQVPGVVIREALRGGPAQAAGLVDGDVLTTIDGAPLDSATALTQILDRHYPGDVIDLTWVDRSGQQRSGKATLGS